MLSAIKRIPFGGLGSAKPPRMPDTIKPITLQVMGSGEIEPAVENSIQYENYVSEIGEPVMMKTASGFVPCFVFGDDVAIYTDKVNMEEYRFPQAWEHFQIGESFSLGETEAESHVILNPVVNAIYAPKIYNQYNIFDYSRQNLFFALHTRPSIGQAQKLKVTISPPGDTSSGIQRKGVMYDVAENSVVYFYVPWMSHEWMNQGQEFVSIHIDKITDLVSRTDAPEPLLFRAEYQFTECTLRVHRRLTNFIAPPIPPPVPIADFMSYAIGPAASMVVTATSVTHPGLGGTVGIGPVTLFENMVFGTGLGNLPATGITSVPAGTDIEIVAITNPTVGVFVVAVRVAGAATPYWFVNNGGYNFWSAGAMFYFQQPLPALLALDVLEDVNKGFVDDELVIETHDANDRRDTSISGSLASAAVLIPAVMSIARGSKHTELRKKRDDALAAIQRDFPQVDQQYFDGLISRNDNEVEKRDYVTVQGRKYYYQSGNNNAPSEVDPAAASPQVPAVTTQFNTPATSTGSPMIATVGEIQASMSVVSMDFIPIVTVPVEPAGFELNHVIHPGNWRGAEESQAQMIVRNHVFSGPVDCSYATYKITDSATAFQNGRFVIAHIPASFTPVEVSALTAQDLKQFPNIEHKIHGTETIFQPGWVLPIPVLYSHRVGNLTGGVTNVNPNFNGYLCIRILENSFSTDTPAPQLTLWVCARNVKVSMPRQPRTPPQTPFP